MALPFNEQQLVERLRHIVWLLRRGPREKSIATIALASIAAGWSLPKVPGIPDFISHISGFISVGLYIVGGVLLCWVVYYIWKQLPSPPLDEYIETRPTPIKGPMAFGPEDGALFRRLGREDELRQLLDHVLNDQIPLVVVRGASGTGKTSLIRAGLSHALAQQDIQYLYWEAVPTHPAEGLLHAIQEQWVVQGETVPRSLEDILSTTSREMTRHAIVLDQFEQLRLEDKNHQPIFDLLSKIATIQMPPHRTTWVVVYRREYDPYWRDFELSQPDWHPIFLSLQPFSEAQAREILATLAQAAGLTLEDALAADLIKATTEAGRVSPVDLGIGMLMLSELAKDKDTPHLKLEHYQFAGGSTGILTAYLHNKLDRFADDEREAVLKALLALVDLDTNQRHAEFRLLTILAKEAEWSQIRLQSCLDYLASPYVRMLEKGPQSSDGIPCYRLPHERLIPSIRQLTGLILAEVDQVRLAFDRAFRAWNNNEQRSHYLLLGNELRKVIQHREYLSRGEEREEKIDFLRLSRQKRTRNRVLGSLIGLLLVGGAYFFWLQSIHARFKADLDVWLLPRDLYTYL